MSTFEAGYSTQKRRALRPLEGRQTSWPRLRSIAGQPTEMVSLAPTFTLVLRLAEQLPK